MHQRHDYSEGETFKSFFDMIIGMVFLLIIMVAAGLVFQQHAPAEASREQDEKARLKLVLEAEIAGFLDQLTTDLNAVGSEAVLHIPSRAIAMPLQRLAGDGGAADAQQRLRIEALARAVRDVAACTANRTLPACAQKQLIQISHLRLSGVMAEREGLSPFRLGQMAQGALQAAIFAGAPDMLRLTNAQQAYLLDLAPPAPGALAGQAMIQFEF